MIKLFKFISTLGAIVFASQVYAADIEVLHAWTHATASLQEGAVVDMLITSKHAATLVGASAPIAKNAEFQTELEENGVFKRHILKSIDLPAGKVVNLSASGEHLILSGLSAELKAGGHIPLTLTFKLADKELVKVEVQVDVRASHHHHHITYEPSK